MIFIVFILLYINKKLICEDKESKGLKQNIQILNAY